MGADTMSKEAYTDTPTGGHVEKDPRCFILGTAGHIDHGKTALVRALTGTDTDRLPEEKKRGMTIDIGFARLDVGGFRFGIVDVPGHERFVRNMVAGAAGNDLVMLVIAADDAVMPQSHEHLEILTWLGLQAGIVVITKCDLADPALLNLVEEDVCTLTSGTFLEQAPIVRTSTVTGIGIDEVKHALAHMAAGTVMAETGTLFRMPIDRAFTLTGRGTIVTGTITSGEVHEGDEVAWLPDGQTVRVRSLETHGTTVGTLRRGQRAAIGLATLHHSQIQRGHELATPGWLRATRLLTVDLALSRHAAEPLRHRTRVRLHLGSAECVAIVSLLQGSSIDPGAKGRAQLFVAAPVTATCGQAFVIRSVSPVVTLGGGRVLQPTPQRIARRNVATFDWITALAESESLRRCEAAIRAYRDPGWTPLDLCRDAGVDEAKATVAIRSLQRDGRVVALPGEHDRGALLHAKVVDAWEDRLMDAVRRHHATHRLEPGMPAPEIPEAAGLRGREDLAALLLSRLVEAGHLVRRGNLLAYPSFEPGLTDRETDIYNALVQQIKAGGYAPPLQEELARDPSMISPGVDLGALLRLAVARAELIHLGKGIYLSTHAELTLRDTVITALATHESGMTVSEIRQLLNTSRKFAVPLCEYLDRAGVTRRHGDRRKLITRRPTTPVSPSASEPSPGS